jgi:hypothetical protein
MVLPAEENWRLLGADDADDFREDINAASVADVAGKVDKGSISFNIRDYGAVGDWVTGTGGTDDTAAIVACMAAASAAAGAKTGGSSAVVLVPTTVDNGYVITSTITVPNGVDLVMEAPFVYIGATGQPAMIIGGSASQRGRSYKIQLMRYTLTDWLSESDVGVVVRNHYGSTFDIVRVDNFTVGVTFMGDTNLGFSYNTVFLGILTDNKIAIDCTNDTGGWCNQNNFYSGRLSVSSSTYTSLDRIGVRVTSRAGTKYYNNALKFDGLCFELRGASIVGNSTCLLVDYGTAIEVNGARHESNSPEVLVINNNSTGIIMSFTYGDQGANAPVMVNNGVAGAAVIYQDYELMRERSMRVIRKVDVRKNACYYDGSSAINVPGCTVATNAAGVNSDARALSAMTLATDYLEVPANRVLGFYMSTRVLKRFVVYRDSEVGFGGRVVIRCLDSGGASLSAAGTIKTVTAGAALTYTTGWNGVWRGGSDSVQPLYVEVSAATDYVFIGVVGATANARLRSISVATIDPYDAETWVAFPDGGQNYATSVPTAGTWTVGRILINAAPSSGQPIGWVCTVAGTPGTWVGYGVVL